MLYRKRKDENDWHYCSDCPKWPASDAIESDFVSQMNGDTICSECNKRSNNSPTQETRINPSTEIVR